MAPFTQAGVSYAGPAVADRNGPAHRLETTSTSALWRPLILAVLLALFTIALYAQVHSHPFANYDDRTYVTENDHVKAGLTWPTLRWALTTYYAANWHPLTWFSHAADYQLFGDKPAGHHDHNLLLHAINVVLLFWVLFRATGYVGRSGMVAALFALHPINTESVVWIAERKNLLSMLFFLLALGAYSWYASASTARTERARQRRIFRYLVVIGFFALALMAKPQVVTLPFVLLLWDYWPLQRVAFRSSLFPFRRTTWTAISGEEQRAKGEEPASTMWRLVAEKLPFLLMSSASAFLTVRAQREGGGFNPEYSFFLRCENALVCYARYLGKAFWPSHLAPMYPHPGTSLKNWQVGLALLVLLSISAFVVWARDRRYLTVGWLWFLGTLVPMIGVVQVGRQAMADRYAYLPFIGLFIMICWGVADWGEQRRVATAWIAVPSCAALLTLAVVTHRQIGFWSDNVTLWTYTAEVTTGNYEAEDNLAEALQQAGKPDPALAHFLRAVQINPKYPRALMFVAVHDQRDGNLSEAIAKYQQVIRETDNAVPQNAAIRATAFGNMGHAYRDLGDLTAARSDLQAAVALNPKVFAPWMDLGIVSQQLGDPAQAAHAYYEAMQLQPSDVGYLLLARALAASGRQAESGTALRKAKLLTNDYERAQQVADRLVAR